MDKKSEKKEEQYPIEFPSREDKAKHSPIVDVVEHEIFPMESGSEYQNVRKGSGVHYTPDSIAEVVATEIAPDTAGQTIHGQQTQVDI